MKNQVSRLKDFDSGSMSDCTSQATDVRATERVPTDFKRWFPIQHFSQSKVSVENVFSDHGLRDLWRLVGANPEPVEIVNTRLRARTSKKHLHLACNWLV